MCYRQGIYISNSPTEKLHPLLVLYCRVEKLLRLPNVHFIARTLLMFNKKTVNKYLLSAFTMTRVITRTFSQLWCNCLKARTKGVYNLV